MMNKDFAVLKGWEARTVHPDASPLDRLGRLMLLVGCATLIPALACSIALMNIGLAVALTGAVLSRAPLHRLPGFWWGLALTAWIGLGAVIGAIHGVPVNATAADGSLTTELSHRLQFEGQAYTWIAVLLTAYAWSDSTRRGLLLTLLAVVLASASLLAAAQVAIGHGPDGPFRIAAGGERLASGWFGEHLTFGFIVGLTAIAFWHGAGTAAPWARWLGRFASCGSLAICMARSAVLGGVLGLATAWSWLSWRRVVAGAAAVMLAGAAAIGGLAVLKPEKYDKLMRAEDGRWAIWTTAIAVVGEAPWFGAQGQNGYRAAHRRLHQVVHPGQVPEFPKGAPHAHNSFLALAAERGIPAVLLYLGLLGALLRAVWRSGDPAARSLALGLITAALIAGQFERLAGDVESGFALFTLLGLAFALASQARRPDQLVEDVKR